MAFGCDWKASTWLREPAALQALQCRLPHRVVAHAMASAGPQQRRAPGRSQQLRLAGPLLVAQSSAQQNNSMAGVPCASQGLGARPLPGSRGTVPGLDQRPATGLIQSIFMKHLMKHVMNIHFRSDHEFME